MRTIRPAGVAAKLGVGIATVWRLNKTEGFPRPFKLSANITVWDEDDIDSYLILRKQEIHNGNSDRRT